MSRRQLYRLIYVSDSVLSGASVDQENQLAQILATARRRNAARGLTGALLFSGHRFAQVLEGPRSEVEALFETIQCDDRHRQVIVLAFEPIPERSFDRWAMGLVDDARAASRWFTEQLNVDEPSAGNAAGAALVDLLGCQLRRLADA